MNHFEGMFSNSIIIQVIIRKHSTTEEKQLDSFKEIFSAQDNPNITITSIPCGGGNSLPRTLSPGLVQPPVQPVQAYGKEVLTFL